MRFFIFLPLFIAFLSSSHAEEEFDFNFDGHMDYRIRTLDNSKGSPYDVFIFDPQQGKHIKDGTLSGLVYPYPDSKTKRVNSIWFGGHSGALFTGSVYSWNGTKFVYEFSVRQEAVTIDDEIHYILVKAKLIDGKPHIFSVQQGDPDWDDQGMSID